MVVNSCRNGTVVREVVGEDVTVVCWTGHAHDQPSVATLSDAAHRKAFDRFAFVSDWQRAMYCRHFGIAPERTTVLRNAIARPFERAYAPAEAILSHKAEPPTIAYTSTPYRGLDLLLQSFPEIRRRVPGVRLKVFSDMKVYRVDSDQEQERFGDLYAQCRDTEGVDHVGTIPQTALAEALKSVTVLAYPNTYPETSCISVMEAMAMGLFVVTSELAALPETAAGFGQLVPFVRDLEVFKQGFTDAVVGSLQHAMAVESWSAELDLRRQVAHANREYTWGYRADEWASWLYPLVAEKSLVLA